jgi:hypothetical protein
MPGVIRRLPDKVESAIRCSLCSSCQSTKLKTEEEGFQEAPGGQRDEFPSEICYALTMTHQKGGEAHVR